jgi:YD repeat-containing protein
MMYHFVTPDRRGHSLIELMVTMSAAVVVLTLSATCLHRMMSISSQSSHFLEAEQTGLRLSRQFRHDTLLASSASVVTQPDEDGAVVVSLLSSGKERRDIEYRLTPARAVRSSSAESGEATREEYSLPAGARWQVDWDEASRRLAVVATNPPSSGEPSEQSPLPAWQIPFEMQLVATIGRVQRPAEPSTEEPEGGNDP